MARWASWRGGIVAGMTALCLSGAAGRVGAQPPTPPGETDTGYYGVRVLEGEGGEALAVPASLTGRFVPHAALAYQHGLTGDAMGHLVIALGAGWIPHGEYTGVIRRGERPRAHGLDTRLLLFGQVAIPVARDARRTQLLLGLRGRQTFALGRHAVLLVASAGARLDTGQRTAGLELAAGAGYALVLPPVILPLLVELVYERFGVYGDGLLGMRVGTLW